MPDAELHLWSGRAIYRGPGYASEQHRHQAAQLGAGVARPLRVFREGRNQLWSGFRAAPNYPHRVDADRIDSVFVWSESLVVRRALGRASFSPLSLEQSERLIMGAQGDLHRMPALRIDRFILETLGIPWTPLEIDSRVRAALETLQSVSFTDEPAPLSQLATKVGLSQRRLRHLFRRHTGMSLQSYRLWRRLFFALQLSAEDISLTEAAHAAGFADSAHLSRVFKASFGFQPSQVLRSRSVQVFVHDFL